MEISSAMAFLYADGSSKLEFSTSVDAIDITSDDVPEQPEAKVHWLQKTARHYAPDGMDMVDGLPKAGYCLATADHPFLDMSEGVSARVRDAQIMAGYIQSDAYPSVFLDLPHDEEVSLEDAADLGIDEIRNSAICKLSAIVSGSFGVRRHQAPYYDPVSGYHQVELVKKSIPSGGSRHPTELFLEVYSSPILSTGIWHFNTRRNALHRLHERIQFTPPASGADWIIGVCIASVVRRAMFRYRDPRSFRAVLVDVGHAEAQLEAIANFCNWRYRSQLELDLAYANQFGLSHAEAPLLVRGLLEGWD